MINSNITFVIFTKNEEKRIEYPVKCFVPFGEVLVFDNYSTDHTRKIVRSLGGKPILIDKEGVKYDEQKKVVDYVMKFVKTDWLFWGFADDMVPKSCLELYKKISTENKYKIVVQKRKTIMFDGDSELDPGFITTKFFRKDSMNFTNNIIHQMGRYKAHVKPSDILYLLPIDEFATYHFSRDIMEDVLEKINRGSSLQAKSFKHRISPLRVIYDPIFTFILSYFFLGIFRYGVRGFIVAMRHMTYRYSILAKKYEIDNNITIESIEDKFIKAKKKLLNHSPHSSIIQKIWAVFLILFLSRLHKWYKFDRV